MRRSLHAISALLQRADGQEGVPAETRDCLVRMAAQVRDLAAAYRRLAEVAAPVVAGPVPVPGRHLVPLDGPTLAGEAGARDTDAELRSLTPQERRILELIAEGCTNRQIAGELFLAEKTVKNYVSNLLRKLGMERRTQAAVFATRLDRALLKFRASDARLPA